MAKMRDTSTNPWKPGDNITFRLKQKDRAIIDYLNQLDRSTTDEILNALELKIELEKMQDGQSEIKSDQILLLKEIEQIVQVNLASLDERMKKLEKTIQEISFRDKGSSATKNIPEDNVGDDEDPDVAAAMANFGEGWS